MWNEFRKSHKGLGYSMTELSNKYNLMKGNGNVFGKKNKVHHSLASRKPTKNEKQAFMESNYAKKAIRQRDEGKDQYIPHNVQAALDRYKREAESFERKQR